EYKLDTRTGNCYKFHTSTPYVWPRANMVCQAEGGHLAVPNSETEAQVLRDFVNKAPAEFLSASIGFKDWSDHSVWMTVHGQTIKEAGYDKWAPGEPNDIRDEKDGENCGSVLKGQNDGLLNDVPCNLPLPFICEMVPNSLQIISGPVDVSRAGELLEPEPLVTPQPDKEVEDLEFLERTYKNPEDIQMHEVVGHKPSEELLSVAVHRARPSLEQGDHYPSLLIHTKDEGADDTRPVIPIAATRLEINN
ncbi:hypothetical protein ACJJTC_011794, partial [Scirpophaga incertulas]